jgi:tRNA-dihydrouridine synthase B
LAARPWLLWQVGDRMGLPPPPGRHGRPPLSAEEEGAEFGRCVLTFHDLASKYFAPEVALRKFRFYIRTISVWLPFGQTLISIATKAPTLTAMREPLQEFFQQPHQMSHRTQLLT